MIERKTDISKLWIVACCSNPIGFKSRPALFKQFQRHMEDANVNLMVVEAAFGDRPHEVTRSDNPQHVQLSTQDEVWHKESMLAIGVSRIPDKDWKYVAFLDGDIEFLDPRWPEKIVESLQHYHFVQPWRECLNLGPQGEVLQIHKSFGYLYATGQKRQRPGVNEPYAFAHPGFAHAFTREAYDAVGGILQVGILGAGDHHMCLAMVGEGEWSMPAWLAPAYKDEVMQWQKRALHHVKKDVGFCDLTIRHFYHGRLTDRNYVGRWELLKKYEYNPATDVKRDWQGLYILEDIEPRQIALRDAFRQYYRARNEDANTLG